MVDTNWHTRLLDTPTSRRQLLTMAAIGAAGVTAGSATRAYADPAPGKHHYRMTVLGTTDTHGHVYNWDYFKDAEYDDAAHNDVGLAKISTLVTAMRKERGAQNCLTLDAGDIIQGTPLAYYYAKVDPITGGAKHPMALAMNQIGYDAAALGNHEFNYGMDTLRTFEHQLDFPLLGANAVDWDTGEPVFQPYIMRTVKPWNDKPIRVGILGLVTPGVAIWDKHNVEGKVRFRGIVEQAAHFVPRMKAAGADLVIVSCHSGPDPSSSYGDALPYPENASTQLAQQVADIDAILVGHAHLEVPERFVTNEQTGRQVLLSEPLKWGMRLTVMDLDLVKKRGRWQVASAHSHLLDANTVPEDPTIADMLRGDQKDVRRYVNSAIGTCVEAMSAETSRYEDTAAMDFINHVQAQAVSQAIAGQPEADHPMLSIAAPFNRDAAIPSGQVTVRDVAGLYIYDNTLLGIVLTGDQIKDYLEFSARYFQQVPGPGTYPADRITNAITDAAPTGTPDYNYDIVGGIDAATSLSYRIDIAEAPGSRIQDLSYAGAPVAGDQKFVVAINNYRQSGGGGFPHVTDAPVVYNAQVEIRQLLIDWVTANEVIDPADFFVKDWRLTAAGGQVIVQDDGTGGHH